MAMQAETRPPVAIDHATLRVTDLTRATEYFVSLGMRFIHQSDTIAVLELRGGTHVVLRPTDDPIPPQTKAPFDLMVDDVEATRQAYMDLGLQPSDIESGTVHRWFTLVGPDTYELTITSSHAGKRAV